MSESQNIQFGAISGGSEGILKTYNQLRSTLDALEAGLQPMVHSWSGAAQGAYLVQKQKWETAADNMATLLNQMGVKVGDAGEHYQSAENSNANLWA